MALHWTEHIWLYRVLILSRDKGVPETAVQTKGLEGGYSCHCCRVKYKATMQNRARRWRQTKQTSKSTKSVRENIPVFPAYHLELAGRGNWAVQLRRGLAQESRHPWALTAEVSQAMLRGPRGRGRSKAAVPLALTRVVSVRNPQSLIPP